MHTAFKMYNLVCFDIMYTPLKNIIAIKIMNITILGSLLNQIDVCGTDTVFRKRNS